MKPSECTPIAQRKMLSLRAPIQDCAPAEWKPIATAPKDGTELLLRSRKGRIASGCWSGADCKTGFWVWPYLNQSPVHWMPIPPAGAAQ